MEDTLKNVVDYYKEKFSKELKTRGLKTKGFLAFLVVLEEILIFCGSIIALGNIFIFAVTKKMMLIDKGIIIIFVFSFLALIFGWRISLHQVNTKNIFEVNRRNALKELRYEVWKEAIEKYVTNDNKKEFFAFLLKVHADGTKKRRIIVTLSDWIITGLLIVNSLPGFEEIKSSNILVTIPWFVFLLLCNLIANKLISIAEDKVLKENYYVQGLVDDYVLVVLAKYE